jgi:glycosyltransferase involved in cell wall biosynthesis
LTGPASITVLVPTRNRAGALRQTLLSMQRQTVPYDEMIVGDDASQDDTRETVEEFRDRRIQYVRHPRNLGLYQNWNDLISRASGDYICIYHDHDLYLPSILQRSRQLLDQRTDVAFVHTALLWMDSSDAIVNADIRPFPPVMPGADLCRMLAHHWHSSVMAATVMARRDAYRSVGPYLPGKYGLGCDKHMWFRLAQAGNVGYIAEPQALIRARERGIGTARFSWANEWGGLQMREEEITAVYAHDTSALGDARRRLKRETSSRFFTLAFRALLLEEPGVWSQEEDQVVSRLGPGAWALYKTVKHLLPIRAFVKTVGLPLYYAHIAQREEAARRRAGIVVESMEHSPSGALPLRISGNEF